MFGSENYLTELNENLNQAQRVARIGSWRYDIKQDKYFGSDEMFRIYGIDRTNFTNDFSSTLLLVHPEDRDKIRVAFEQNLNGKSSEEIFRIPQSDNSIKYVYTKATPIINEQGEVVTVHGILQDITEKRTLELKLKKYYNMLSRAEELAHLGSWEADVASNTFMMSDETYRIYGIDKNQFDNPIECIKGLIYPEDLESVEALFQNPPDKPFEIMVRILRQDGAIRHIFQRIEITLNDQGKMEHINGTIQDITEKIELENKLQEQKELTMLLQKRFQILVEKSKDVFQIITPEGTIVYVSDACESILGYKPEDIIGGRIYQYFDDENRIKLQRLVGNVIQEPNKMLKEVVILIDPHGRKLYLEIHLQNLLDEPIVNGIIAHILDVTDRIDMEDRIIYINEHDEITNLPNRIHLNNYIDRMRGIKEGEVSRFALMLLDITGLKNVNYTFGYTIGDNLIIIVAERIKECIGQEIYISRYSDDHLALIIQKDLTYKSYGELARRILELFVRSFIIDKYDINISANIGISVYPDGAQDKEQLKEYARVALFRARKDGINCYRFYSRDNDSQNNKELVIRRDLNKAIQNNQLRIYYQPMVELKTKEILAAEALVRWEHPEYGLIPPNEFISIAEETGFIIKIGDWMLEQVCKTYKQWIVKGYPAIKVSINFSSIQFFENNFVDKIIRIIGSQDLDPSFLIVEITESIFMNRIEKAIEDIKRLQSYGIQVALDDFGTGYSSLAYLNSFHINILKIDRSFIRNIPSDYTSSAIIKGIINMAKDLKIKLVAEGIENWEQLNMLQELNCYSGQGYLFSRPVNLDQFDCILRSGQCFPMDL